MFFINKVTHKITLDVAKIEPQGVITLRKGDSNSHVFDISFKQNAKPYVVETVSSVIFRANKPDGKSLFNYCAVESGIAKYVVTSQTTAASGVVSAQIEIVGEEGEVLYSPSFTINVVDTLSSEDSVESENELSLITQAIVEMGEIKKETRSYADQAAAYATTAEESAASAALSEVSAKESCEKSCDSADQAEVYAENAHQSKEVATDAAILSQSYAVGNTGVREGEENDNAKYYKELADMSAGEARDYAIEANESAQAAEDSMTRADTSADTAVEAANESSLYKSETATLADKAKDYAENAAEYAKISINNAASATLAATTAEDYSQESLAHAYMSKSYAIGDSNVRDGEDTDNAKYYKEQVAVMAEETRTFATTASNSAGNAEMYKDAAAREAATAMENKELSALYKDDAKEHMKTAKDKATEASDSAVKAANSASSAESFNQEANAQAIMAQSYASGGTGTRDGENMDNSKYYYEQCKSIASGDFVPNSEKGVAGGVATLDKNGYIPASQLPAYVDDVIEGRYINSTEFVDTDGNVVTPESGKVYIDISTGNATSGKTYRWSGSVYAVIGSDLALGTTSSTAFRGDYGQAAYEHSTTSGNPHGTSASDIGLGNVPNVSTNNQTPTYTTAESLTGLSSGEKLSVAFGKIKKAIATLISHITDATIHISSTERAKWDNKAENSVATTSAAGLMSSIDKTKLDGIASGANAYSHPVSGVTAGTYRSVTVDANGHVTAGSNPTIALTQGGTGATSAAGARTNLGLGSAATCSTTSSVTSGSTSLVTSGAVYAGLSGKVTSDGTILGLTKDDDGKYYMDVLNEGGVQIITMEDIASSSVSGLMSNTDKSKLDGIAAGANKYTHPSSGVTAGTYRSVTVDANGHVTAGSNPTVTVAQGGTGATSAAGARTNLGLGSAATCAATTSITSGSSALVTSGAVHTGLAGKADALHTHDYLPTSGGTVNGNMTVSGCVRVGGVSCLQKSNSDFVIQNTSGGDIYTQSATLVAMTPSKQYGPMLASAFNIGSSKRIKTNVVNMSEEEARKILDVNIVDFDYIDEVGGATGQHGVIAEEVNAVIPSVVNIPENYDENEELDFSMPAVIPSVDYSKFVPYLIKMVQIQQKQIDKLKEEITGKE